MIYNPLTGISTSAQKEKHMKFKLFLFIAAVLVASACGGTAEPAAPPTETPLPTWPEFTSETGGFAVKLPSTPVEEVQTIPSEAGDLNLYIYMVEEENAAMGVMFNELPEIITSSADDELIQSMLDGGRDGAVGNMGGNLVSEEEISIDGHPGRHIVFNIPDAVFPGGGEGVARIYYVDGNLYQVMLLGVKDAYPPEMVEMFLDSFQLLP